MTPEEKFQAMKSGERVVVGDRELDHIEAIDDPSILHLRSIPNPRQIGTLDRYIAWIEKPRRCMAGAGSRRKGENILSFMDRVMWDLAARLARDASRFMERVYLWYIPSTETEWGSVVVDENQPDGYILASSDALPRLAGADRVKNVIYAVLRKLPVIPTSDEAFERGMR